MLHFLVWTGLVAVVLGFLYAAFRVCGTRNGPTWFCLALGPFLPAAFWLYGMLFDWGNAGRLEQYLMVRRIYVFVGNPMTVGALTAILVLLLVAGWYLSRRLRHAALDPAVALLVLGAWYVGSYCLSDVPFELLEWREHNSSQSLGRYIGSFMGELVLPFVLGVMFCGTAIAVTCNAAPAPEIPLERNPSA